MVIVRKHKQRLRFTFLVGPSDPRRKCSVYADNYDEAVLKARREMDRRYEKSNRESPVAWDLECVEREDQQ